MLTRAKGRAKAQNVPFDLTISDIVIPSHCPILGIALEQGDKPGGQDNSPSLDKIVPSLGYVKGNIAVISHKANKMKSNATTAEVEALLNWMTRQGAC